VGLKKVWQVFSFRVLSDFEIRRNEKIKRSILAMILVVLLLAFSFAVVYTEEAAPTSFLRRQPPLG
jgi:hypothetical protein